MKKRTFLVNKIVRDKSKELFVKEGQGAEIESVELSHNDKVHFFKEKLHEELQEVLHAKDIDSLREELADLLEVIYGFVHTLDKTMNKVEKVRLLKLKKKGGFDSALFVASVTLGNEHPFISSYLANPKKYPEITK